LLRLLRKCEMLLECRRHEVRRLPISRVVKLCRTGWLTLSLAAKKKGGPEGPPLPFERLAEPRI
jgi:hypothetical protein